MLYCNSQVRMYLLWTEEILQFVDVILHRCRAWTIKSSDYYENTSQLAWPSKDTDHSDTLMVEQGGGECNLYSFLTRPTQFHYFD